MPKIIESLIEVIREFREFKEYREFLLDAPKYTNFPTPPPKKITAIWNSVTRTVAAGLSRPSEGIKRWALKPKVLENELNGISQIYLR